MCAEELEIPSPTNKRKPLPIVMAHGAQEYLPGQQEDPVLLTTVSEMVQWAQNWARSRSIWPFTYALACCGIEMIAAASAPQYDLSILAAENLGLVQAGQAHSIADLLELIRQRAALTPAGQWIRTSTTWDESNLTETRIRY